MQTLKILFILALTAAWFNACAPGLTFSKKGIKTTVGTSPADMHHLSQAKMRHTVASLGDSIAQSYAIINQQYQQLVNYNPNLADSNQAKLMRQMIFYGQKIALIKPFMTFSAISLETYGRTFAQPDDDKVNKSLHTNANSIASNAVGRSSHRSSSQKLIPDIPGAYYKNGRWYMNYDQEGLVPLYQDQAEWISQFPKGVLAKTVKNKYLRLKNKS